MESVRHDFILSSLAKRGRCLAQRGGGGAAGPTPPTAFGHSPRERGEKSMVAPCTDGAPHA
jgi:hypothetical protein